MIKLEELTCDKCVHYCNEIGKEFCRNQGTGDYSFGFFPRTQGHLWCGEGEWLVETLGEKCFITRKNILLVEDNSYFWPRAAKETEYIPCPFCNSTNVIAELRHDGYWVVQCHKCWASTIKVKVRNPKEALKRWNNKEATPKYVGWNEAWEALQSDRRVRVKDNIYSMIGENSLRNYNTNVEVLLIPVWWLRYNQFEIMED